MANRALEFDRKKSLPGTLHGLLRVAIRDLRVIASEEDRVNMGLWAVRDRDPYEHRCAVCAAGAVMIGTLKLNLKPGQSVTPSDFGDLLEKKLLAIDALRCGKVVYAAEHLYGLSYPTPTEKQQAVMKIARRRFPTFRDDDRVTMFEDNRDKFFRDAYKLQKRLEKAGI